MSQLKMRGFFSSLLDLFFPGDPEPLRDAPIYAFIHGDYWYAQRKENFSYVAQGLIQ